MNNADTRLLIIDLLDDEDGICDVGYSRLYDLACDSGNEDVVKAAQGANGKWFLNEDVAEQFRGETKPPEPPKGKHTLEDFGQGDNVNVTRKNDDPFNHDFTGHVKEVNMNYVVVEDQDGNCWDCDPDQLSFSSDDIMHGN